jgi:23S rRNA (uracil1939-C5)-methyltransferase
VEVRVAIDGLDDDGRGVGHAGGLELHVAGALPGEQARVRVEHQSPHAARAWGALLGIDGRPAQERVAPACPGHGACGGCALQHLAYPAQLTAKRRLVERALAEHAILADLADLAVDDVVASPHELHYRNKAKYVVATGANGELVLGSYAPGSHRVIDMAGCQVPEEPIDDVARRLRRLLEAERVPAFDERRRQGELRYLILRRSAAGALLVVIVTFSPAPRAALGRVARALPAQAPAVAGVVHHVNPTRGGALFASDGPADVTLDGAAALDDTVGDVALRLSARAFFQVNRAQAARLYAEAAAAARARPGARLIDLYAGVGGIALTASLRGADVVGVEIVPAAVDDARRSAEASGPRHRARFLVGDAADGLPAAARLLGRVDAIIVNPPRKGLAPAARDALLQAAPARLVYVSCGPRSLAVDLAAFVAAGYRVESVRPFDLLPGTPHVETLVSATRGQPRP